MNQGNNTNLNNNVNNVNVTPTPMPATKDNTVTPQQMPATPTNVINPTPVNNVAVKEQTVTQEAQVAPTQTVVNTQKKKGSNIIIFVVIILIIAFVYFIDDVLAYFNQNFTPVVETTVKENAEYNLVDGYIKINETNSYKKIKGVKFDNVRKGSENAIFLTYVSDRNYSNSSILNLEIELYNENKELIYNETFKVNGSIEAGTTRQYKITLDEEKYNSAFYALIIEK